MKNPNDVPEVCECGHEPIDHNFDEETGNCLSCDGEEGKTCDCVEWRPKDDQFYVEGEFDARAEKYDRSRE